MEEWLEAFDFFRGGRHVLNPGRIISKFGFILGPPLGDGGDQVDVDASQERLRSRFERVPIQSYLWPHINEDKDAYEDRTARAVHIPIKRHIIDTYRSAALRRPPKRTGAEAEPWKTYHKDVDFKGTSIDEFVGMAMGLALCFGLEFAITDRPKFDEKANNRKDQIDRGERAYSYLVNPMDLINWRVDIHGVLDWVIIRESAPDVRNPGEEMDPNPLQRYRVWFRDRWELWEELPDESATKEKLFKIADQGDHPVGEVPLAIFYARRGNDAKQPMIADSMLADMTRIDRRFLNAMSVTDEILAMQGFSQTYIPEDSAGVATPITMGPGRYVSYNSENGVPLILTPPAEAILTHMRYMQTILALAKETSGVGRGKAEASKEERSAEALLVETRNENNRIVTLVNAAAEFDAQLHRHVAAWEGAKEIPTAEYNRDVSLRGLSKQIDDALKLQSLGVPVEAMRLVIKPLVAQHMQEQGLPDKDVKEAVEIVDAMVTAIANGDPEPMR